jgi:hypothetical protein
MATTFVFAQECPTLLTVSAGDILPVWDTSAGVMKRCTVSTVQAIILPLAIGSASSTVVGFYGETGVNQGTQAATAITALTTATISAGNAAAVWAWASSTEATAFVTRAKQAQTDLDTLMARINSTGVVSISGL